MLEAAHIITDEENRTDDPRNGIVLCSNHHRAFDGGLLRIHPETLAFTAGQGRSLDVLRVSRTSLTHMSKLPHPDALRWRWRWKRQEELSKLELSSA
jgi:hypothetical protein